MNCHMCGKADAGPYCEDCLPVRLARLDKASRAYVRGEITLAEHHAECDRYGELTRWRAANAGDKRAGNVPPNREVPGDEGKG